MDILEKRKWLLLFALYVTFGLLSFSTVHTAHLVENDRTPFYYPLIDELTGSLTAFLLLPGLLWFFARLPITTRPVVKTIAIYLLVSALFGSCHTLMMVYSRKIIYGLAFNYSYDFGVVGYRFLMEYHKQLIGFVMLLGVHNLLNYYQRESERRRKTAELELKAAQLSNQLSQIQIQALKGQLQPHFLFNTLNMISSLMYEDIKAADRMIIALSRLLRLTLDASNVQKLPLAEELAYTRLYLEIMQARFQEKLEMRFAIADDTLAALVPNMILQPLVENSIKHNDLSAADRYYIEIRARKQGDRLLIDIIDNGPGLGASREQVLTSGIGLSNIAERLKQLYGGDGQMLFANRPARGLCITIDIPFDGPEYAEAEHEIARASNRR